MSGALDRVAAGEDILRSRSGSRVRSSVALGPLTSFRLGGPAALYLEAEADSDLVGAGEALAATNLPWIVLGKGSNVLVSDQGFPGLVIRLGKGYRWAAAEGERLRVGAAMPLPRLAGIALTHSLAGIEFGVAIPGSLGGAVVMNAGAHGRSMQEVLEVIDVFSLANGERQRLAASEADLSYRHSRLPQGAVVVGATLELRQADRAEIRRVMDEARDWRRATQPLAEANCGSVFKNPPGDHAARLVEEVGGKDLSVGGAEVSQKHANFIVARPGARAADVDRLIRLLQERVEERFGLQLEPEVQRVGDFDLASL